MQKPRSVLQARLKCKICWGPRTEQVLHFVTPGKWPLIWVRHRSRSWTGERGLRGMFRLREQLRRLEVQYGPHWAKKRRYWQGCIACEVLWGVFAIWRLIKEKDKPTRGSTTRQAVWDGPWQGGMRWFRGLQQGAATQKGRGQRDSQWRGGLPV